MKALIIEKIYPVIAVILSVLMTAMVIGTAFFQSYIGDQWRNYLLMPHIAFYVIALVCIFFLTFKNTFSQAIIDLTERHFKKIFASITIVFTVLCVVISLWIPTEMAFDWYYIQQFVLHYPDGLQDESLKTYFQIYPYQLNVATIFALVYKLTHAWRAVILTCGLLAVCACVITSFTVYNVTHNKSLSIFALVTSLVLIIPFVINYEPYTDNFCIPFPILALFILTTNLNSKAKLLLITIVAAIIFNVRIVSLIPIMAICLVYAIDGTIKHFVMQKWGWVLLSSLILVTAVFCVPWTIRKACHFERNINKERHISHFLNMGQNTESIGGITSEDIRMANNCNTIEERDSTLFHSALQRIKSRGIIRNIYFTEKKLITMGSNGVFYSIKETKPNTPWRRLKHPENTPHDLIANILIPTQKYHKIFASHQQLWLYLVLLLVSVSGVTIRNRFNTILALTIIGHIVYQLIFEIGGRYIVNFIPFYVILATLSLYNLRKNFSTCKRPQQLLVFQQY